MPYRALLPLLAAVGAGAQTYVNGTGLESNDPGHPQDATGALCSGRPRPGCEVQLDVPEACTPQAGQPSLCPVVFYLNGAGGNNRWTSRVRSRPDDGLHVEGYVGVYPLGDGGWNTGPKPTNQCAFDEYDCTTDPDETGFFADIITHLRERGAGGNVYVVGGSNGGALAHKLAANAGPELPIKGIVAKVSQLLKSPDRSGAGPLNYNRPGIGARKQKVSVLSVTGGDDTLIPPGGGKSAAFLYDETFQLMPALTSMETWALHNGCAGATDPIESEHLWSDAHGNAGIARRYRYTGCEGGHLVEHYLVEDGGHSAGDVSIDGRSVDYALVHDFIKRVENRNSAAPTLSPTAVASIASDQPTLAGTSGTSCVQCSDETTSYMTENGIACPDEENRLNTRCSSDANWIRKQTCKSSCHAIGKAYDDDNCCAPCLQCSNNPTPWMLTNGKTCEDSPDLLARKCNLNDFWTGNKYCAKDCDEIGMGYSDAFACCDATTARDQGVFAS